MKQVRSELTGRVCADLIIQKNGAETNTPEGFQLISKWPFTWKQLKDDTLKFKTPLFF